MRSERHNYRSFSHQTLVLKGSDMGSWSVLTTLACVCATHKDEVREVMETIDNHVPPHKDSKESNQAHRTAQTISSRLLQH